MRASPLLPTTMISFPPAARNASSVLFPAITLPSLSSRTERPRPYFLSEPSMNSRPRFVPRLAFLSSSFRSASLRRFNFGTGTLDHFQPQQVVRVHGVVLLAL